MAIPTGMMPPGPDVAEKAARVAELNAKIGVLELMIVEARTEMEALGYAAPIAADPTEPPIRPTVPAERLTVAQFAAGVGISTHSAYRLLEGGAVPGSFKTHPTLPGSRWFIPSESVERFRARGERDA